MAITMYGTYWCGDCKRSKQFLGNHRIRYDFIDIDADSAGALVVEKAIKGGMSIPVIEFEDGSVLIEPSNVELADKLGVVSRDEHQFHDVTIVGSGPAGLAAALYTAREGLTTLVIERGAVGGQAGITERLDNYPGFPEGVGGEELADRMHDQALRFGVEILQAQDVVGVSSDELYRIVRTADDSLYLSHALLLALGTQYRRLDIPGESEFIGAGVHFCATCDGPFYRDQDVLVIGGGNSAAEESLFLARFARKVTIAVRGEELSASRVVREKIAASPKIEVLTSVEPVDFSGKSRLERVALENSQSGDTRVIEPDGVFVFVGLSPNTEMLRGVVELDERGFVITDQAMQTNVPGIFAAGDCRSGSTKQAASAVGEGAAAALAIRPYVEPRQGNRPAELVDAEVA
ncbi:hypothetical protein BH23CHL5_BH23CHL5_06840 [soil metagenome]